MVLDDEHPNTNINEATPLINDSMYDGDRDSEHKMALFLELWFLVHVVGQMLVQLLTLGAIASKIFCENQHYSNGSNGAVKISPYTWVMIVLGFLLPLAGTLTFFIPTYGFVQTYSTSFIVSVLGILRKCGPRFIKEKGKEGARALLEAIPTAISNKLNMCRLIMYPLCSTSSVVPSIVYLLLVLTFLGCYPLGVEDRDAINSSTLDPEICGLNITLSKLLTYGTQGHVHGWFVYTLVVISIAVLVNVLVISIGMLWIAILILFLVVGLICIYATMYMFPCFPCLYPFAVRLCFKRLATSSKSATYRRRCKCFLWSVLFLLCIAVLLEVSAVVVFIVYAFK